MTASSNASSAHAAPTIGATAERTEAKPPRSRLRNMFARLQWIAFALLTIFVCASATDSARRASPALVHGVVATVGQVTLEKANVERTETSRQWRAGAAQHEVDFDVVECDDDERDDDRTSRAQAAPSFALIRREAAHEASRSWHAELGADTSRFAAGTGLPRGPPV